MDLAAQSSQVSRERASRYAASLREYRFFLWELFDAERVLLGARPYAHRDRAFYDALLDETRVFADELGKSYHRCDVEGCELRADGSVRLPSAFPRLWDELKRFLRKFGLIGSPETRTSGAYLTGAPPLIAQVFLEMLAGANPSFVSYGGFTLPAAALIRARGTPAQKDLFVKKLLAYEWDACFCVTESGAGSDVSAVRTYASVLDGEIHSLVGEKIYITAGMHGLTENTVYLVLARCDSAAAPSHALSCFLVPRLWVDPASGARSDNNVECLEVVRKMGLNGCANTRLAFGKKGLTRAWLLGNQRNVGLLQLIPIMQAARVNTGLYGVGVASSAYLNSVIYANARIQGTHIEQAFNAAAPRVRIAEHADVQRMLIDMKARVEGCRGLLGKHGWYASLTEIEEQREPADRARLEHCRKLTQLLTPIVKAYISDQAWRICELAIQVHGGIGYTDAAAVEQNARDVKVLSIWEGTNYIQAQDLVRDKLGFGRNPRVMSFLAAELRDFAARIAGDSALAPMSRSLMQAFRSCETALAHIQEAVAGGHMHLASQFFTRLLEMLGTTIAAWVLLEGACVASNRLPTIDRTSADGLFYEGKIKVMRYFYGNLLPVVDLHAAAIANMADTGCTVTIGELAALE